MDHGEGIEMDGSGVGWTDDRHASFLNRMEENFIRAMLGSDAGARRDTADGHLLESTAESSRSRGRGNRPNRASGSAPALVNDGTGEVGSTSRRVGSRRRPATQSDVEDQVVPELAGAKGDGGEGKSKDWRGNRNNLHLSYSRTNQ
ncbi:hypothetical protein J5N97_029921 [Dioscorea zingiberensis]|uniref:Uncharacterized protein n=1 Tax=Dioscorea zingiberensis TaxID=325984 RepID=A0A9D5BWQ5_9LILI|nr:hypothetical protein J5N97_029921 [Dioscorea zingiberensis]